ncbi:MAG: hypothetical protein HRT77_01475 [Halioglobus sp.]|nr:hypothetical protein [Halioglobus sp.]
MIKDLMIATLACLLIGLTASADSANTASTNLAGVSQFSERAIALKTLLFNGDTEWGSTLSTVGQTSKSDDSSEIHVPRLAFMQPINERWGFDFTCLVLAARSARTLATGPAATSWSAMARYR